MKRKILFTKILLSALVIYALFLTTACPSKSALEKGFNASTKISKLGSTAAITIGELYTAKVITLEVKDAIVDKLRIVQENGRRFHNVLSGLAKQYKGNVDNISREEIKNLDFILSTEVIAPFAEILTAIGLLPVNIAKQVLAAIALLKAALMMIASIFDDGSLSYEFYKKETEANGYAE